MLREALEDVIPYISNLKELKRFVDEFEGESPEVIIHELERRVKISGPQLSTDYRILLTKFEEIINKGK